MIMAEAVGHTGDFGHPARIPPRGWWQIAKRVSTEVGNDNVSLLAAGLALYALLAAVPGMTVLLSIYGLLVTPEQAAAQMSGLTAPLPEQAASVVTEQIRNLASQQQETLGIGAVVAGLLSLWSARKGMAALITATNVAYDEEEERGFIRRTLTSLGFTAGAVIGFIVVLLAGVGVSLVLTQLEFGAGVEALLDGVRWIFLWCFIVFGLAVVYRWGPDRARPRWRWVTPGSALAALLWVAGSLLFGFYVSNFGSYGETYGSLGGVVVLLMWFYLSGFIVILGAEINAEIENEASDPAEAERAGNDDHHQSLLGAGTGG